MWTFTFDTGEHFSITVRTLPTYTRRTHLQWGNFTWVPVFISLDSTREHEGKFSWGSALGPWRPYPVSDQTTLIWNPISDSRPQLYIPRQTGSKKDVFYFSIHVIATTAMSSHLQKLPSFSVARKIQGTLWVQITSSKTKKIKIGNPSQTWKVKMEPQPVAHSCRTF